MNLDVASYIEHLLFEHESVIIPDLGGIVSAYRSASIDNVQGLLHPPSKALHFNKNLIINDGILIKYIAQENQVSEEVAKQAVDQYVEKTQETLNRREIIVFPGVGRLYKDYEGNLQFLQDSTNFNPNSYGLSSVQFYPILRNKENAQREAPVPQIQEPIMRRKESRAVQFLQSAMPLLAGLALVAFGLTFYMFENEPQYTMPQTLPVAEKHVNKKPSRHEASIMSAIDKRNGHEETHLDTEEVTTAAEPETTVSTPSATFDTSIDTESITLGPDQKEGVIIIGTYNYKASVQKMVNQIYELGYDVYKKKKSNGKSTRVGVQFVYEDTADLEKILKRVRHKIDDRAWILKR